jgi:hypothetical protein
MTDYGRNFEFLVAPSGRQRKGRFFNDGGVTPIGVPVVVDYVNGTSNEDNALGMQPVVVVDGATNVPTQGTGGIMIYEYGPNAYAGDDTALTVSSDKDTVPAGAAVQVVSGTEIKVRLRNTVETVFLQTRTYAGRTMVAGLGATPTVAVGELLTPAGTPNDTNGYWAETATAAEGWLVITKVDADRNELEAQMTF